MVAFLRVNVAHFAGQIGVAFDASRDKIALVKTSLIVQYIGDRRGGFNQAGFNLDADRFHPT
jgi:hypothetical protein